jgi:hypothetical protein
MKREEIITALALPLTCASPLAMALSENGDREFTLSGSGTSDKGFDNNSFGFTASIEWFTSDAVLWGLRQNAKRGSVRVVVCALRMKSTPKKTLAS